MYLTLEVVSPQSASLGADRRRTVGPQGLTIGRVPGNDWVIPDPYVSKQHARISFVNGSFFVESLGRNAIALGTASNALQGNKPQPLKNGDHLFIDQYEIIVTTMQGDPPRAAAALANDDPFGVLPAAGPTNSTFAGEAGRSSHGGVIPEIWDAGIAAGLTETDVLDPLTALGGGPRSAPPEALPPVNWQQASPLDDHFEPPPVRGSSTASPFDLLSPQPAELPAAAPIPGASGIPDNWDRTNLINRQPVPAKLPQMPASRPVTPSPGGRPANRDMLATRTDTAGPSPIRPPGKPVIAPARIPTPSWEERAPNETPARTVPPPHYDPTSRVPTGSRVPESVEQSGTFRPGAGLGTELTELLHGAGLSDQQMSPEMVRDLGRVLRVVVQGVMDVLRARTDIKSQFRLPLTRIQSEENNPLKHSPNVESALHTLLVQRNPGYLSTVQAFEDAFADIRSHQMAMLEGVRTAFESMLESFDPKHLEREFEGGGKRGSLFGSAKSKYWELYVDRFAHLGGDADDTFRRLFGDVFAEAYEKQLERLKTLARNNTGKT